MKGTAVHSSHLASRVVSRHHAHAVIITVSGDIDFDTVAPLNRAIRAVADRSKDEPVVLDLSQVQFAGASLINALLYARAEIGPDRLRIAAPPPCVIRLLHVASLDGFFTTGATVTDLATPTAAAGCPA
ncbi:STAS domain-containing protein [Streptomyces sp. H39-C1]|uniref:STAS domain-containing protein n=1 Tax=Streptomyces sp. H39-C1 TaxID=3004355 RepID=UPI0022B03983|nr:STAS domain-containing protein [Streptomyces sp. H39-C1]MCZ4103748.1 STAS domain-containing protein [Streptomyces sp. H39-C1]